MSFCWSQSAGQPHRALRRKATGVPVANTARVMAGEKLADFDLTTRQTEHVAVKEAVFPFSASPGSTSSSARR